MIVYLMLATVYGHTLLIFTSTFGVPGLGGLPSNEDLDGDLPIDRAEDVDNRLFLIVKPFIEDSVPMVLIVDTDDKDDISSSSSFPLTLLMIFDAVELCLFFLGIGGSTLPGNSVRRFLSSLLKSPYRRPIKYSSSPFRLTLNMNSYHLSAANPQNLKSTLTACL
jgi:hypothetical protein